jgi:signal recognition particle subunit SRP19
MDPSNFRCIYPSYLDATKALAQGRRIGAAKAVDTPTVSDISQALQSLNIRHVLQPHKGYSRDVACSWDNPGRVKYECNTPDNTMTKRELLVALAALIDALPSRQQRLAHQAVVALEMEQQQQKAKEEAAQQQRSLGGQKQLQQQHQSQKSKKKGKKKR